MTPVRLHSLDILRGLTMAFLCLQILRLPLGVSKFPDSAFWGVVSQQTSHVAWTGMNAWDLIQPLFMFMVGAALPWSLANRRAAGQRATRLWLHMLWRALALVAIGVMLRSLGAERTQFVFTDVLSQIGLGYPVLFALAWCTARQQIGAGLALLVASYLVFIAYPAPDYAAHWLKGDNAAAAFDLWFQNLWPRAEPFVGDPGGYSTANFLPAIVTMLGGLLTGELLRTSRAPFTALKTLLLWSLGALLVGLALDVSGLCPSIKRIWTPSWVLVSGGCCGLLVAASYWLTDVRGYARPFALFRVLGLNSLILYVLLALWEQFLTDLVFTHLGWNLLAALPEAAATFAARVGAYLLLLGFCVWLHYRRIYLRL